MTRFGFMSLITTLAVSLGGCGVPVEEETEAAAEAAVSAGEAQEEWRILDTITLEHGDSITLKNQYLKTNFGYGVRDYGINLVWYAEGANLKVTRQAGAGEVKLGDRVALYVRSGGYLKYGVRDHGINLVWSSTPAYEWEFRGGGATGDSIDPAVDHGLYNTVEKDYLVYCSRLKGINLKWAKSCDCREASCSSGGGNTWVAVKYVCGIGNCPAGYHPERFQTSACQGSGIDQTVCRQNKGLIFTQCGVGSCPSGYRVDSTQYNAACWLGSPSLADNQTTCVKL